MGQPLCSIHTGKAGPAPERTYTNTCTQNAYKFEGKERDAETQNDDFGARYYTWRFGRWLSSDWSAVPVAVPYANLTNPQTLNLYAMVADDPESFSDLDGHVPGEPQDEFDVAEAAYAQRVSADQQAGSEKKQKAQQQSGTNQQSAQNTTVTQKVKAAAKSVDKAISNVSDWLNDHPFVSLAVTLGMSLEKDGPALEESVEETATAIEEEAGSILSRLSLNKSLASEQQMSEIASGGGTVIAGSGSRKGIDDIARLTAEYGGTAKDWVKVASSNFRAADGTSFETHAYKNVTNGQIVEYKTSR